MNSKAYLHGSTTRGDGTKDTFWTQSAEMKDSPLWQHERGRSFTASGFGRRIPTRNMVMFNGKWRRVYCCIYSNSGTCYIGKLSRIGENIIVKDHE